MSVPRSSGSASIVFGLIRIPIKVYPSNEPDTSLHFNILHEKCKTRVNQQYYCQECQVAVSYDETIKGFEIEADKFITFTHDELKEMDAESTHLIEIDQFVEYFSAGIQVEKTDYLAPDKGAERSFHLFRQAMMRTDAVAVGKWNARGKSYIVALRPYHDGLMMQSLRYPHEIRDIKDIPITSATVAERELKLATKLIQQSMTENVDLGRYQDEVTTNRRQSIAVKARTGKIPARIQSPSQSTNYVSLEDALTRSLKGPATKRKGQRV